MVTPTKPLAGYVRVSRVARREVLRSPELQQDAIRRYAETKSLIVEYAEPELDVSGSKRSRPILDAIIERIRSGELGGIVVAKLDRLARMTPKDRVLMFDDIEGAGGIVLSAGEDIDPTTRQGRMQRDILLAVYREQWEKYQEEFNDAKRAAILEGIPVRKTVPVGYMQDENRKLKLDPKTAPIVREAFAMRARGSGPKAIADYLEDKLPTSTGAKRWSKQSIYYMLKNRIYVGEIRNGSDENLSAHEALIDRDTFKAAQKALGGSERKEHETAALLSGILRCEKCSYCMAQSKESSHSDKQIYRCVHKGCTSKSRVASDWIEPIVMGAFWKAWEQRDVIVGEDAPDVGKLKDDVARATEALERWNLREDQDQDWEDRWEVLRDRKRAAEAALGEAEESNVGPTTVDAKELWPHLSTERRRWILRSKLQLVSIDRDRERIVLYLPDTYHGELPKRGKKQQELRPIEHWQELPPGWHVAME